MAPDKTLRSAASHLGLFSLPMSHKKDARLKRVMVILFLLSQLGLFSECNESLMKHDTVVRLKPFYFVHQV